MRALEPEVQGTVEVDGVGIGYEVFGSGPRTILLAPPWAIVSSRIYKAQVRFNRVSWRRDYEGFLDFFFREMFPEPHSEKPIEDCVGWGLDIGAPALECTMDAPPAYTTRAEAEALVAGVKRPVLVIHGDRDRIVPLERGRRVAALTGGELVVRVLAACDVALVQGGLTTGMELVAAGTPFVSFPLKRHFEQRIHVAHRLARHGHTRALELEDATPDGTGRRSRMRSAPRPTIARSLRAAPSEPLRGSPSCCDQRCCSSEPPCTPLATATS